MKKKLIATLVAGAVLSTGIIGLTACGNSVSLPKGEQVADATAWAKAFEDTAELTNFTYEASLNIDQKGEGTLKNSKGEDEVVKYTAKTSSYNLTVYDKDADKAYVETTSSMDVKGTHKGKEEKQKSSGTEKDYYELKEKNDLYKSYWNASYTKTESNGTDGKYSREDYWDASSTSSYASNPLGNFSPSFYENGSDEAVSKSITTLYDKFTYSGGVYTAELYRSASIAQMGTDRVKVEVKVSFSGGYVIGVSYKASKAEGELTLGTDKFNYTYSVEAVYALKDIKKTDASKKANKDIKNAIQEAKDELENN